MTTFTWRPKNRILQVGQGYSIVGNVTTVVTTIRDVHGVLIHSCQKSYEDTAIELVVQDAAKVIATFMAPVNQS